MTNPKVGPRLGENGAAGRDTVRPHPSTLPRANQAGASLMALIISALARAIVRGRPAQAALFARSAARLVAQRGLRR